MLIKVKCSYILEVEVPDDKDYDAYFDIEENHCPGTGIVGKKFDEIYEDCNKNSTCWACKLQGKNEII